MVCVQYISHGLCQEFCYLKTIILYNIIAILLILFGTHYHKSVCVCLFAFASISIDARMNLGLTRADEVHKKKLTPSAIYNQFAARVVFRDSECAQCVYRYN